MLELLKAPIVDTVQIDPRIEHLYLGPRIAVRIGLRNWPSDWPHKFDSSESGRVGMG